MKTQSLPFIQNLAIMASAGTGKTYQLAMRFIALLLAGVKPEEIVAITFSRKAAGEILEKIVSTLLELIQKEDKRIEAAKNGFIPIGTSAPAGTDSISKRTTVFSSRSFRPPPPNSGSVAKSP